VAATQVRGPTTILTFDKTESSRYAGIQTLDPAAI
jgi:hypothetical protein